MLFSLDDDCNRNIYKLTHYTDTIFISNNSNLMEVQYTGRPPIIKHDCIWYCINTRLCDVILIAFKTKPNAVYLCKFYKIGLQELNLMNLPTNKSQVNFELWNTILYSGFDIGVSTELIIIGI